MKTYVEHANITVSNLEQTIHFLQTALPDFSVRYQGMNTKRWCHIGTEQHYLALQEAEPKSQPHTTRTPYFDLGINHIGLVVSDIQAVSKRLLAAGFRDNHDMEIEPHRTRFYAFDDNGIEWEFIEYQSDVPAQRNLYEEQV